MGLTIAGGFALFVIITLAFVAGQTLTLLLFKRDAFKRKAVAVAKSEATAETPNVAKKLRTRGGNYCGGAMRR